MAVTFEYCSLHYLNIWLKTDMNCCAGLINIDKIKRLDTLKQATEAYKVHRTLPTKYDVSNGFQRYEPLLKVLDSIDVSSFPVNSKDTVEKMLKIESQISKKYGDRGVLSLTTKLLWLKFKSPIRMYDSQARKALNTPNNDLSAFYKAWDQEFAKHKTDITKACANLVNVRQYSVNPELATELKVKHWSSQKWFKERVFDMYLWEKGN
jgi:hypothetical protein